ncbi:hypothetical protein N3K66_000415 [Trichothecium roseum]|uniref:Uncharacterized protein n=1 Tax=Trichothecium roseum TaxID=47278 RepID=A0ACC0VBT9_9HYPO|nr:hypothetical protein N3K66_000415 [Trichothecium roseum]
MAPLSAKQPFKAVYTAAFCALAPPLALLLAVKYAFRPLRPDPSLPFRTTLVNALARLFFTFATQTRAQAEAPTEAGKLGGRFALCRPVAGEDGRSRYSDGILGSGLAAPATMPGAWFPAALPPPSSSSSSSKSGGTGDEKVILHFPGGAYVLAFELGFCGAKVEDPLRPGLGADRLFLAQYRLSRDEGTRFPAALQDAVTFYRHVLDLGFRPQNIILSGDSAGGNLALALLRYLEDDNAGTAGAAETTKLPVPGAVACFSPWVDVAPDGPAASAAFATWANARSDMLTGGLVRWGTEALRPRKTKPGQEPYLSPLRHPFRTSARLFLHAGGADVFRDGVVEFARRMGAVRGNSVLLDLTPGSGHDIVLLHDALGLTDAYKTLLKRAKEFIDP